MVPPGESPSVARELTGRKLVVLGASSGIGQSLAQHALRAGAEVLLCGRREDRLVEVRHRSGGGEVHAVDLSRPEEIDVLAERVRSMAPVDAVVSTVGIAPLRLMMDTTYADWRQVLDTNVVGVNSAIRAVLPSLADGAIVLALSSEAVTMPRWALGAYSASKAALEVSLAGWRTEYPRIRFGCVGVGATVPTEFARHFEQELLFKALEIWARHGQAHEQFMDSDHLGAVLALLLGSLLPYPGVNMEHIVLRTPSPVTGSSELMMDTAFEA